MSKISYKSLVFLAVISVLFIGFGFYTDYMSTPKPISLSDSIRLGLMLIANIFNMLYIFFMIKENIFSYIYGLVAIIATFIYLVVWSPLIWDILINIVYFVLNFYGIYYWLNPELSQKRENNIAKTRNLSIKEIYIYTVVSIVGIIILSFIGQYFGRYTSVTQAIADAFTTILSIVAQWLTTRKILESWFVWLCVNIISIPLYISIGSYTFAMGFFIYAISSLMGYMSWRFEKVAQE